METVRLRFVSNRTFISFVVRLFTWSKFSHVDYIFDDRRAYSALPKTGVDYNEDINDYNEEVVIEVYSKKKFEEFLLKQQGKGYDWKAIIGMPLHRNWHDKNKWFCSELLSAALENDQHVFKTKHHRVTPGELYAIAKGIEQK